MANRSAFTKLYSRKKGGFKTAKEGYNMRIRYFYCKECRGCHIRKTGEPKVTVCEYCGHKKLQYIGSMAEAKRFAMLTLLEKQNDVSELRCQVKYSLDVNDSHICNYNADFVYLDHKGVEVVEDVKPRVWRDEIYLMKKKLMLACHGIVIEEVN